MNQIKIKENSSKNLIEPFDKNKDEKYLEKFLRKNEILKENKKIRYYYDSKGKAHIDCSSYVGIIELSSCRLNFKPKIENLNFFYILKYLKNFENVYFDSEKFIKIKEGSYLLEFIANMFLNELEKILNKSLLKKYVKEEENLNFLKGKLILKNQLKNDFKKNYKFNCRYYNLTYDNLENRIVLRSLNLFVKRIKDKCLKKKLLYYESLLKEEITLCEVTTLDCDKIQFNRLNNYYKNIIAICKIILRNSFIFSYKVDKVIGFNFLVNMEKLYEDFLTAMFEEVTDEKFKDKNVELLSQYMKKALLEDKNGKEILPLRPDIIIKTPDKTIIIDAKYKKSPNNANFYQLISYVLGFDSEKGVLIFPKNEEDIKNPDLKLNYYHINDKNNNEIRNKKDILIREIDLGFEEKDQDKFIKGIKKKVEDLLNEII